MNNLNPKYKQAKGNYPALKPKEKILLDKRSAQPITSLRMGLGWDPILKPEQVGFGARKMSWVAKLPLISNYESIVKHFRDDSLVDLDASCIILDNDYDLIETVFFRNLISSDGAVRHSGDNLTGIGDGDDECIDIDLLKISENVRTLIFVVNSFSGQTFDLLSSSHCRVVEPSSQKELARVRLATKGKHTALMLARLLKSDNGWVFQSIDEPLNGNSYEEILPFLMEVLNELDQYKCTNTTNIWETTLD